MSVDGSLSSLSSPLDVSQFNEIHVVSAQQVTSCASSCLSYESSDAGSSRSSSRPVRQRVRVSSPRVVRSRVRLCDGRDARTPSPSIGNGHGKSRGLCQGLRYGSGWRRQGGVPLAPDGANDVVPSAMALQGHDLVNQGGERGSAGRLRVLPPEGGVEERGKSIRSVHSLRHVQDADRVREIPQTIGGQKESARGGERRSGDQVRPAVRPPEIHEEGQGSSRGSSPEPPASESGNDSNCGAGNVSADDPACRGDHSVSPAVSVIQRNDHADANHVNAATATGVVSTAAGECVAESDIDPAGRSAIGGPSGDSSAGGSGPQGEEGQPVTLQGTWWTLSRLPVSFQDSINCSLCGNRSCSRHVVIHPVQISGQSRKIRRDIEDAAGVSPCPPHAYFGRDGREINLDKLSNKLVGRETSRLAGQVCFSSRSLPSPRGKKRSGWFSIDKKSQDLQKL